jgi:S1-C subfamily serine protease
MSEQPRTPAQGPDSGRGGRSGEQPDAGSHDQVTPPASAQVPEGQHPAPEPIHPWQGGANPAGVRGVPAGEFAPPEPPAPATSNGQTPAAEPPPRQPRLAPRPVQRPPVDPAQSAVFRRPRGLQGSFAPEPRDDRAATSPIEQAPPAPDALAKAFGRPPHNDELLQRAPGEKPPQEGRREESTFWNDQGDRDPWRSPASGAVIGPPAVTEDTTDQPEEPDPGPLLSTREVLFGRRVRPRALIALTAVAVLLAAVGGFVGRITAEEGNPLTDPSVTLAEPEQGVNRPAGTAAGVAKRVVPAVVSVDVRLGAQGGTGSGVVIDGNGYVVTNNHVISMAADSPNAQVSTVFHEGTRVPARIVGRDVKTDLAVLKVEVSNPTVAQLGRSSTLAVGDDVIAIGSPLGLASTVTTGIVSSVHRPMRLAGEGSDTNAVIDAIQTDAAINPGNSGGALVDGNGAVVGINSAIRTLGPGGEGGSIGLGFAIPIDDARRIAQELIRTGQVRHADLGVNAKSVSDGTSDGAQVQNVQEGSSAAAAGVAEGDVIIRVGANRVTNSDELIVAVDRHQIGETVPITVVRQGRELVLNATLR